jgi:hypothetical protein
MSLNDSQATTDGLRALATSKLSFKQTSLKFCRILVRIVQILNGLKVQLAANKRALQQTAQWQHQHSQFAKASVLKKQARLNQPCIWQFERELDLDSDSRNGTLKPLVPLCL